MKKTATKKLKVADSKDQKEVSEDQLQIDTDNGKREKKAMHLSVDTWNQFKKMQSDANGKDYGKRISLEDVASAVVSLVDSKKVVEQLRKGSMRPEDHIRQVYENYCKENGDISYEQFVLLALTKQIKVDIDLAAISTK